MVKSSKTNTSKKKKDKKPTKKSTSSTTKKNAKRKKKVTSSKKAPTKKRRNRRASSETTLAKEDEEKEEVEEVENDVEKPTDTLITLNADKEGGIDDCLKAFCVICEKNDLPLKNKESFTAKTQTGVKVLSMYRRDRIISYLQALEKYKNADPNSEAKSDLYQVKKKRL